MQHSDLGQLSARLGQLAEAFDRKSPPPGALLVWLDVLKEFPLHEVESMLVDMPKRLTKFPAPADVYKACNERRSERVERESVQQARAVGFDVSKMYGSSEVALRELGKIKAIIASPRPDQKEWARVLRVRHESGENLSIAQVDAYKRALGLER